MVKVIMGKKGSGKTKKLIEAVNTAAKESKGNVICIEKGNVLTYDVDYQARLIDISDYEVTNHGEMLAFLSGLLAGNYDITDIFVDSILKVCGPDLDALGEMLGKLSQMSDKANVQVTLTVSADPSAAPESVVKYQ